MLSTEEKIQKIRKKYPNITITLPQASTNTECDQDRQKKPTQLTSANTVKQQSLKKNETRTLMAFGSTDYVGTIIKEIPPTTMGFPAEYGLFIDSKYTTNKIILDGKNVHFAFITTQETTVTSPRDQLRLLQLCKAAPSLHITCQSKLHSEGFKRFSNGFDETFWENCEALVITGNWSKSDLTLFTNSVSKNIKTLIMREFTVTQTYELQCLPKQNVQSLRYLSFDCRCTSSKDIVQNVNIICGLIKPNKIHRLFLNVTGYPVFKKQGNNLLNNRMDVLIDQLCGITNPNSTITILTEEHVDNEIHENLYDNNFTYVGTIQAKKALHPFDLATYHIYELDEKRNFTFGLLART